MSEIERVGRMRPVETLMIEPAQRAGYDLTVLGTSNEPDGEMFWQAPSGRWWLFRDHRSDPTVEQYGGMVVPSEQREKLVRLLQTGFSPDIILTGHELPLGHSPGDPLPELVPTPRPQLIRPRSQRHAVLASESSHSVHMVGRVASSAIKRLAIGAVSAGIAMGIAMSNLDPVVLAGVRDPNSGALTWVEVARWSW